MKEGKTLIEFLLNNPDEELTSEYLLCAEIDTTYNKQELKEYINKKQAEARLERGRRLKAMLGELLKKASNISFEAGKREEMLTAFRKLGGVDEKDISEIEEDEKLLEELNNLIKNELR